MQEKNKANALINESSPYLLQHAYNPVEWNAWNEQLLERAKKEDKLILVSIGYSACHWCHVMEHESFEDNEVAEIMNKHFINIKIDREERPDIDQVYMSAVQLMTGQGGWPLNCFILPDGRPIYGGTYFPKEKWKGLLLNLVKLFEEQKEKCSEYAQELTNGILKLDFIRAKENDAKIDSSITDKAFERWSTLFDFAAGGNNRAPKFPMPNNYMFLMRYAHFTHNQKAQKHLDLTLQKMALGGIYDQIGGGFARYSTDMQWKAPHFEKMLYDNAQLLSLYSEAYTFTKNSLYKTIVEETFTFLTRELMSEEGCFYSALDADTEGEEGKYYVWTKEELKNILDKDFDLFSDCYQVNEIGYWEHDNYILVKNENEAQICVKHGISQTELAEKIISWKKLLLAIREKRVKPGLDDKSLTSWNGLAITGCVNAWQNLNESKYLTTAVTCAEFIHSTIIKEDGGLWHSYKKGKTSINGFLEDYAFVIEAYLNIYPATKNEIWLHRAKSLAEYVLKHFSDQSSPILYFTSTLDAPLITRNMETQDNVIPASNSQMARNFLRLGHYFSNTEWIARAGKMLSYFTEDIIHYCPGYSNWAILSLELSYPFHEVAIVGKNVDDFFGSLRKHYLPNTIFAISDKESAMPLLEGRFKDKETLIYVCKNFSCLAPVTSATDALKQLV